MTYTSFPKGSEWRKWDLHVHTPVSLKNNFGGDWERFISELEALPAEFAVIGINDYLFLDGYKRLKEEKEKNGRLKNIQTLFPVVEFRIKKFAGVEFRSTTRINLHIIFDPELKPEVIESQFLNTIHGSYALAPNSTSSTWNGVVTRDSLEALGAAIKKTVPADKLKDFGSDLEEGFNNLNVDESAIFERLETNSFLKGHYLNAVGKSEWDKIAWDDTSIAEKKDIINKANLVFTAAASEDAFNNAKSKLVAQSVNSLLLDCSDAHNFENSADKDRIGNCLTWIKADPTFKGLLQVVNEPNERCFIGSIPPKLDLVAKNKTKFISSLQITKKPTATISEVWFDNINLPLNPDMVAIIGNKGKGKSALTDIIGLLGNTKQYGEFTFLSENNFRQRKDNKAKHFQAELKWENGEPIKKGLEETVDEQQPERIKYIPQHFLENICTQIGQLEETEFDRELKKVIFSHVEKSDRLEKSSLEELLEYQTSEAMAKIEILRQELHPLNEAIVAFEEKLQPEYKEKIQNILNVKQVELRAAESSKPAEVPKPGNDPSKQKDISDVAQAIETEKAKLVLIEKQIAEANDEIAKQTRLIAIADKLIERLGNLDRQIQTFLTDSKADFEALGLSVETILKVTINRDEITKTRAAFLVIKQQKQKLLNESEPEGLVKNKIGIEAQIAQLQSKLDEPNKKYQAYTAALKAWEAFRATVIGADNVVGTIKYYEKQLSDLANVPTILIRYRADRLTKAKEIYAEIKKLADTFSQLYVAVNQFIQEEPLAKNKLHLKFDVSVVDTGFESHFFDIVNRGVVGTFCGVEDGHKKLDDILKRNNFNSEAGIESFLTEILKTLEFDCRSPDNPQPVRVIDQIRKTKDKSVLGLYDLIFSLSYMRPRYSLRMGEKELHELSPGERGALLLVFYLLVDRDDVPLVIDQPEENLDNQTVYELLVPCMKAAKDRRQIIIVTHNPNLAVVCDAEQVIFADLDKKNNNRMQYIPGSIESPVINKAIVDILEGTMPAFDNRGSKYH